MVVYMPYNLFDNDNQLQPDNKLPLHLEHKPIFAMSYQRFDGIYRENSDARFLSVGISQWAENDISVKVMRHTSDKCAWIPLMRLDAIAIF